MADSNRIHTPLLPGVLGAGRGGGHSPQPVSQFTSRESLSSEHPTGAGQKGYLKIYKTRELRFMARKKSHESGS